MSHRRAARGAHAEEEQQQEHKESSRRGGAAAAAGAGAAAAGGRASAAPSADEIAAALSHLTSGLSWAQVVNACKALSKQLQADMRSLPPLHQQLTEVAEAALGRAGREGEEQNPCKSTVDRCRAHLERLIQQEEQLGALLESLSAAQTAASSGALQHDVKWAEYIGKRVADIESSAAYRHKLSDNLKKALDEFSESCWRVNHGAEPMPGRAAAAAAAAPPGGPAAAAAEPDTDAGDVDEEGDEGAEGGPDDGDGDVLAVGAAPLQLKCPFTTEWLEDPVRSRTCLHRYSRAPVTAYLLGRQAAVPALAAATGAGRVDPAFEAPCQQAGCRRLVSLSVLVDDPKAARDVAKAQAEERRAAARGDAGVAAAAAAAAARKRRRGTVKQEARGAAAADGTVNDLTQQEEEEQETGVAAAAAAPSPQRRASKRAAH